MRTPARRTPRRRCAFSLIELLVVIGIIAIVIAIMLPMLARAQATQRSVNCRSNLRQIGLALSLYAHDHRGRLPDPSTSNLSWEQMLLRYHKGPFQCPADQELYPTVGSSYDWRDTGDAATTLAGRLLSAVRRQNAVMAYEALPGWHAPHQINVVRVDGSADAIKDEECVWDLRCPLNSGTRSE